MNDWESELRSLTPGWDGEDAPPPSDVSISVAKKVAQWIEQNELPIDSIDADVIGGVAIYLSNQLGKTVWVSIMNSGFRTIVFNQSGGTYSLSLGPASLDEMKSFLSDKKSLSCIEGATVQGTINESGNWEPMVSIPVSEYEELLEFKFMYENLSK